MKYLAPNAFTATSLLFGLASIIMTVEGRYIDAGWFALWCVLLDKADGFAARLLKAQSRFGVEFDSFADQVGFGIAPAVMLIGYFTAHPEYGLAEGPGRLALLFGAGIYALANSARLARYNIAEEDPDFFNGLPTTVAGGLVVSYFLVCLKYGPQAGDFTDPRLLLGLEIGKAPFQAMPAILLLLGISMVSPFRIPKLKPRKELIYNIVQVPNVVGVYVFGIARWVPEYLMAAAVLYVLVGLIIVRTATRTAEGQPAP